MSSGHQVRDTPNRLQPVNVAVHVPRRDRLASQQRDKTHMKKASPFIAGLVILLVAFLPLPVAAQDAIDGVTGFPRQPLHVAAWPGGKKVAVSFALFVEAFGFGQGPVFRPDLASRNPDLVNEAFREYAIHWGIAR